jgi:hypothetical protein
MHIDVKEKIGVEPEFTIPQADERSTRLPTLPTRVSSFPLCWVRPFVELRPLSTEDQEVRRKIFRWYLALQEGLKCAMFCVPQEGQGL